MPINHYHYLKEGHLTRITPLVKEITDTIQSEGIDLILDISEKVNELLDTFKYISSNDDLELMEREYQQRTVDEIIKSKYFFGCSDVGLLFVTFCRAKGIPAKFIHCVDTFAYKVDQENIAGHVYAECFLNGQKYLIDPNKGLLKKLYCEEDKRRLYKIGNYQMMVEAYTGLDNYDAGIRNHRQMLNALVEEAKKHM